MVFAGVLAGGVALADQVREARPCASLTIRGELAPPLRDVEMRMVCGDPQARVGAGWKTIPPAQARFHLRTFLQERGYLAPRFIELPDGNILEPGEPMRVRSFDAPEAPPALRIDRKRQVIGEILTPKLLSSLEQWATQRLQAEGYPCPEIKALGNSETGAVTLEVKSRERRPLAGVRETPIPGLDPEILRRYDAFRPTWPFDGDALTLTENRVVSNGILQGLHFAPICPPAGTPIPDSGIFVRQDAVAGLPRLFSVGFGLNTEGLILARTRWENSRMGNRGSSIQLSLIGSTKEQQIEVLSHWYFRPGPARFHFQPSVRADHKNENFFESLSLRVEGTPMTTLDVPHWGALLVFGPTVELIRTLRGPGAGDSHFASFIADLSARTHDFEYFITRPRRGMNGSLRLAASAKSLFSTATAQRLGFHWEALWNYRGFDPPLLVFGVRSKLQATFSPERAVPGTLLPANFLSFLGGSADLRGFGRQELPGPNGAMSAIYGGAEIRLANTLPLSLEPFLFLDIGALGAEPFGFDSPIFRSPGVGVRWASPIGTFRSTFARGAPDTEAAPSHWQFFLSYGEEF